MNRPAYINVISLCKLIHNRRSKRNTDHIASLNLLQPCTLLIKKKMVLITGTFYEVVAHDTVPSIKEAMEGKLSKLIYKNGR